MSAVAVPHPSALAVTRYRPGASASANCPAASVTPPGSPAAPRGDADARAFDWGAGLVHDPAAHRKAFSQRHRADVAPLARPQRRLEGQRLIPVARNLEPVAPGQQPVQRESAARIRDRRLRPAQRAGGARRQRGGLGGQRQHPRAHRQVVHIGARAADVRPWDGGAGSARDPPRQAGAMKELEQDRRVRGGGRRPRRACVDGDGTSQDEPRAGGGHPKRARRQRGQRERAGSGRANDDGQRILAGG